MALIKCPECGKEISDRAKACPSCGYPIQVAGKSESTVSSSSGIIDSGIVSFSVTAPTISSANLPSRVQEEIANKSALLRSEGKTIVNINKSDPYSIGGVYSQIDVDIVWNRSAGIIDSGIVSFSVTAPTISSANLPSRVQEEIANKSALLRSEGKTIVNINKSDPYSIGGVYSQIDVDIVWNASGTPAHKSKLYDQPVVHESNGNTVKVNEQMKQAVAANAEKALIEKNVGPEPNNTGAYILFGFIFIMTIGFTLGFIINGPFTDYNWETGETTNNYTWGILGILGTTISVGGTIWKYLQARQYKKKVEEYKRKSNKA